MVNFEKLAIKLLLDDSSNFRQINGKLLVGRVPKYLYQTISAYFTKFGHVPTPQVLVSAIQNTLPEDKVEIYEAYLDSLLHIKELPTIEEIVAGLSEKSLISNVDKNIEDLTKAAYNKDVSSVREIISKLNASMVLDNKQPKDIKDAVHVKETIKYIDSCIASMRVNNVRFSGLSIIGAGTGQGKSVLSLQQALYTYKQGYNVTIVSLELPEHELLARLYSCEEQVEFSEALVDSDSVNAWKNAFFDRPNFFHILTEPIDSDELLQIVDTESDLGCDLFVIDYLQLVEPTQYQDEWKALAQLVRRLHLRAVSKKMVILSPTQINVSEIDDNGDEIKVKTRGSRELENSSSLFICLYSTREEEADEVTRLFTIKARNGVRKTYLLERKFNIMRLEDTGVQMN